MPVGWQRAGKEQKTAEIALSMARMRQDPHQGQDILALAVLSLLILQTRHHLLLILMHSLKVLSNGTEEDSLTGILHSLAGLHTDELSCITFIIGAFCLQV